MASSPPMLEPKLAVLDETDSGLDIDALKIVADGVNRGQVEAFGDLGSKRETEPGGDEAEECWRIVEPVLTSWAAGTPYFCIFSTRNSLSGG